MNCNFGTPKKCLTTACHYSIDLYKSVYTQAFEDAATKIKSMTINFSKPNLCIFVKFKILILI